MKINLLMFLFLAPLIGCNLTPEQAKISEEATPAQVVSLDPAPIDSLEALEENEELLLRSQTCNDNDITFHNIFRKYNNIKMVYKNKVLNFLATSHRTNPQVITNFGLKIIPDGIFFQFKPASIAGDIFPPSAFDDLLYLETLTLKSIQDDSVTFETTFLSQTCSLSFSRENKVYANDLDRDHYANDVDCAPANPGAFKLNSGYLDLDGDGYGGGELVQYCGGENDDVRYSRNSSDCNDSDSDVYPGAEEQFDGIDNNCNGMGI